jgi:hypothetical protein
MRKRKECAKRFLRILLTGNQGVDICASIFQKMKVNEKTEPEKPKLPVSGNGLQGMA